MNFPKTIRFSTFLWLCVANIAFTGVFLQILNPMILLPSSSCHTNSNDKVTSISSSSSPSSQYSLQTSSISQQQTINKDDRYNRRNEIPINLRHNVLSIDYTKLQPTSELAKRIRYHQQNCSISSLGHIIHRNDKNNGLASDLHVWTQAMCNAMEKNVRLYTTADDWIWNNDSEGNNHCFNGDNSGKARSFMSCLFTNAEKTCPQQQQQQQQNNKDNNGAGKSAGSIQLSSADGFVPFRCPSIVDFQDREEMRTAGVEYLFTKLSPIVLQEAQKQIQSQFHSNNQVIPDGLIAVHLHHDRRGGQTVLMDRYIDAIYSIIEKRLRPPANNNKENDAATTTTTSDNNNNMNYINSRRHYRNGGNDFDNGDLHTAIEDYPAQIYVMSTDIRLLHEFQSHVYPNWKVHVANHHDDENHSKTNGLKLLGNVLIALEANDYVLSTNHNWSRLLNEIRTSIIDVHCNHCTNMIDVANHPANHTGYY